MFTGRSAEVARLTHELEGVRATGAGRFVWLRGRRRIGKSRLVQEFCDRARVRYCFFQATQRPRPEAVMEFVEAVRESSLLAAAAFDGVSYATWPPALRDAVRGASTTDPAVLVIDELPYLVAEDPRFSADLQKAWDRTLSQAAVLLVCVGSDVRMMDELLRERAPLHGRPTLEMRLQPLSPKAVGEITGAADPADAIDRYLLVGGFPLLAASWPAGASVGAFLDAALVDDQTPFVTTALRVLSSEFQRELQAARVIEAIGHGESAFGRISARSGAKGNTLTAALDVLIAQKGLVARELPYAVPVGKQPARYTVVDPYLRFWLRFVQPGLAELSRGRSDLVVGRIRRDWATYRGRAVEPVIRDAVERLLADPDRSAQLGGARNVGAWWKRDHSIEVDLVGGDAPEPARLGFVGSIKWHEQRGFTAAEARQLAQARAAVPGAAAARLLAVTRTQVDNDAPVDEVLDPAELLSAWD